MIGADLSGITPISSDVSHNLPKSNSSPGREKTHPARQKLNGRVSYFLHEAEPVLQPICFTALDRERVSWQFWAGARLAGFMNSTGGFRGSVSGSNGGVNIFRCRNSWSRPELGSSSL